MIGKGHLPNPNSEGGKDYDAFSNTLGGNSLTQFDKFSLEYSTDSDPPFITPSVSFSYFLLSLVIISWFSKSHRKNKDYKR